MAKFAPKSKAAAISQDETKAVVEKVSGLKPADVAAKFSGLSLQVQQLLAQTGTAAVNELAVFAEAQAATAAQKAKLEELFGVENALLELDEVRARVTAAQEEHAAKVAELEQTRKREQADYFYNLQLERNREAETYKDGLVKRNKAELADREARTKQLEEREAAVDAREARMSDLEAKVAGIDDTVKAAVARAEAILNNTLKKDHAHELAILEANAKSAEALSAQKVMSLEAENARLRSEADAARRAVESANERIKEIALSAANASSGQMALAAVMNKPNGDGMSLASKGR